MSDIERGAGRSSASRDPARCEVVLLASESITEFTRPRHAVTPPAGLLHDLG